MRLEDALLYVIVESDPVEGMVPFCEAAIAGGADVIHLGRDCAGHVAAVSDVCRREDALLIVSGASDAVVSHAADGAHVCDATAPVGQYRAEMENAGILGMSTRNRTDALLALEMGVDYLLHWEGIRCPGVFASLPGAAGNALFAAGLSDVDEARHVVEAGVYRICIKSDVLKEGTITDQMAVYSRLLGRCI